MTMTSLATPDSCLALRMGRGRRQMLLAKSAFFLLCLLGCYAQARSFYGVSAAIFGLAGYIAGGVDVAEHVAEHFRKPE